MSDSFSNELGKCIKIEWEIIELNFESWYYTMELAIRHASSKKVSIELLTFLEKHL